jgi:hypothetical protein
LHDLWTRWNRGDDPSLFVSYIGGPDGWRQVPWITEKFIEQQRRQFASVPSKFLRLWENTWATGDLGSFLTADEIRAAIDPTLTEPLGRVPGGVSIGVDVGLSFDTTGIVAVHVDANQKLIVDAVRILRGTRARPVSLMDLEEIIVELARRLGATRITIDQWQAAMLAERLRARGLPVQTTTSDPAHLDRWATRLKTWFSTRTIKIPQHAEFVEQLEGLEGEELRRRDRVRFTATGNRHDDSAIALCLAGEHLSNRVGRVRMAEQKSCALADHFMRFVDCYLFGAGNYHLPSDRVCRECPGHQSTVAARDAYQARTGQPIGLREFVTGGLIQPNTFVLNRQVQHFFLSNFR